MAKQRKKQKKAPKKNTYNLKIMALLLTIALVVTGGFLYSANTPQLDEPYMELSTTDYSFGVISQSQGMVSTDIIIKNIGGKNLVLDYITTSCGCTTAKIVYRGISGPTFSMAGHGVNPTKWEQVIQPGETAKLRVFYDPNAHGDFQGAVSRSVTLYSNDSKGNRTEIRFNAQQIR